MCPVEYFSRHSGVRQKVELSPNSTWLVTSRLDTPRHVRRVEPMHFGCVELDTLSTVERVVSSRDVT